MVIAFNTGVEFRGSGREDKELNMFSLAGGLKGSPELTTAIDLKFSQRIGPTGCHKVQEVRGIIGSSVRIGFTERELRSSIIGDKYKFDLRDIRFREGLRVHSSLPDLALFTEATEAYRQRKSQKYKDAYARVKEWVGEYGSYSSSNPR